VKGAEMNKQLLVASVGVLVLCSFLFGQTLTEQYHLQYNNGLDRFTRDIQPIAAISNGFRLSSSSFAYTNPTPLILYNVTGGGASYWSNLGSNGNLRLSVDGTNWLVQVKPYSFARFDLVVSNLWVESWPTNGSPVVPFTFDVLPGP
jgi:hypothetical protein